MSIQSALRTLKTVKRPQPPQNLSFQELLPPFIFKTLPSTSISTSKSNPRATLSDLNSTTLHQILTNPNLKPSTCFQLFDFLLKNQSSLSFKPNLHAHLTLVGRLLKSRWFSKAETLLKFVSIETYPRYPFSILASTIENCCCFEPRVVAKLFNSLLKVYSDNGKFDQVLETFDHMKNRGIRIDERTCTLHLLALDKYDQIGLVLDFFVRMMESGIEVSAYSCSVVVHGLCRNEEIKRCRELMELIIDRGIKPNIVSYNILINACMKRWNFEELDNVLALVDKQGEGFNENTYKILISGYSSCSRIEEAENLLLEMHNKDFRVDVHLYNLIIRACCRNNLIERAISLFDKMNHRGVGANADTYWGLINDLCQAGKVVVAMVYVSKMLSNGIELDEDLFNLLIDAYFNKKMVYEAFELLVEMDRKGLDLNVSMCEKISSELCNLRKFEEAQAMVEIIAKRRQIREVIDLSTLMQMG